MAFDAFLKIDGIDGESTDDKHKDWIEILSFNHGLTQTASGSASTAGGASAERASFMDFSIVKALDKGSPKIFEACATGKHIKTVTVELCRAGGDKVKYMEYKLSECIVSSYRPGGSAQGGETLPLEEVSFNYGKIELSYTVQKRANGSGGGKVAAGWDLTKNTKV
ncbi:protein hcp1 [Geobacter sp. OR-1]|uniref:Hcp family type VI secretion system effector n=1 Tax=Geobacter sp. OR-1 TaxID=1266765 RepID=UPI000543259E|nr:type VI secretion system tube protein Hcp [Geobacter sp. OR-1]GAM09411.1 protein hcp1 [Geobacter sp. OR-1]